MIIYISLYIQSLNYYKGGVGGFRLSVLPGFGRDFRVCLRAYRRRLSGRVIGFAVAAEQAARRSAAGSPSAVGAWVRGCVGAVLCRASERSRGGAWFVHFDGAKNHLKKLFSFAFGGVAFLYAVKRAKMPCIRFSVFSGLQKQKKPFRGFRGGLKSEKPCGVGVFGVLSIVFLCGK